MAHTKFPVEVLTPEGAVFSDEVEMISTVTTVGSIGILARRAPLLAHARPRPSCACTAPRPTSCATPRCKGYLQFADDRALVPGRRER